MKLKSNWIWIAVISILLIFVYLSSNPFKVDFYSCLASANDTSKKLTVAHYIDGDRDVTFKNSFFSRNDCNTLSDITCSLDPKNNDPESIIFNTSLKSLKYQWVEYESGKYVFDKTQVISTNKIENYACELLLD